MDFDADLDDFSVMVDSTNVPVEHETFDVAQTTTTEGELKRLLQQAQNYDVTELANFISEKLVIMIGEPDDLYQLAQSYYKSKEYERALELLNKDALLNTSVKFRYLAGLCSIALGHAEDALAYLGRENPFKDTDSQADYDAEDRFTAAVMCLARGKAFMLAHEEAKARECFKEALKIDVKCYDALLLLIQNNMLDEKTDWEFVETLSYDEHCGSLATFFRYMYRIKMKKQTLHATPTEMKLLEDSVDVKLNKAMKLHRESRLTECFKVCEDLKEQDPYFKEAIPLRLDCLYKLGLKTELYEYAKHLVDKMNKSEIAWHAVGLYYLYVKNSDKAQQFFKQALQINRLFQQSWLGLGHAFAAVNNYEEAIEAYTTCSKLIPGSHLPLMYLAEQHLERNDIQKAGEIYQRSLEKSDDDPYLYEKYGMYYYKIENYEEARKYLQRALRHAKRLKIEDENLWVKIWCDLGNVYQHPPFQNYQNALRCCRNALLRNPRDADAHTTAGKIYHSEGNYAKAIAEYHEALHYTEKGSREIQQLLDKALEMQAKSPFKNHSAFDKGIDFFQDLDDDIQKDEVELELAESSIEEERVENGDMESRLVYKPPALSRNTDVLF
ncbi:hypothetical protein BDF20DRAFT_856762 [Mycotypha africana]|uniref:uncharacterized protein n=1 Tax=Mycotypha africana TaxID=64632 RepID=UPI0023005D02|nr:uncharacterized protein BDF20DRAFT_856762 [Mycotypha africana]KAI8988617.1 hypothetical protein BDF20DRAFT_856762 [Mycotypha africana]